MVLLFGCVSAATRRSLSVCIVLMTRCRRYPSVRRHPDVGPRPKVRVFVGTIRTFAPLPSSPHKGEARMPGLVLYTDPVRSGDWEED